MIRNKKIKKISIQLYNMGKTETQISKKSSKYKQSAVSNQQSAISFNQGTLMQLRLLTADC